MSAILQFDCLSLFPEMLRGFATESILGRAMGNGLIDIRLHNIRDWAGDKHHITDDAPFGGGAGMVMRPEPIFAAVGELRKQNSKVIYLCPDGELLTPSIASELAKESSLILLSGPYEGVDQRVRDLIVDREISIGDYVLTNGTLASAVLVDVVSRHVPGVLGSERSLEQDSFSDCLLSFPHYTRPAVFMDVAVPEVLLYGNHGDIASWRHARRMERTRQRLPDLLGLGGNLEK